MPSDTPTGRVNQADVGSWIGSDDDEYDLVLADPPYSDDSWADLLDNVKARYVVAETGGELVEHPDWDVVRQKTYGTTVVTVLSRRGNRS